MPLIYEITFFFMKFNLYNIYFMLKMFYVWL